MISHVAWLDGHRRSFFSFGLGARFVALGCLSLGFALGGAALAAPPAADDDEDPTKPQDISLKTGDGLELKATFYPSTLKNKNKKDAVPLILLHGWKGDRGDCEALALYLQSLGHAVVTPDLRGHGQSKEIALPDGSKVKVDANTMRLDDIAQMWAPGIAGSTRGGDMEAIKSFLFKKNNAGELNIERLGVVGADMGATVAVNWAAVDWSWPVVATGKQGQDVKALALISPEMNFKGFSLAAPLNDPEAGIGSRLSYLIAVGAPKGRSSKPVQDANSLRKMLQPMHPDPPEDERAARQTLFFDESSTNLQGTKLLNEKSTNLDKKIAKFIELRLVNPEFPWTDRSSPLK